MEEQENNKLGKIPMYNLNFTLKWTYKENTFNFIRYIQISVHFISLSHWLLQLEMHIYTWKFLTFGLMRICLRILKTYQTKVS